jgi:hypothetical protein
MWSEEEFLWPHRVLDFLGRVAYGDEVSSDRDGAGVLWSRVTDKPREGSPQLGKVHSLRQRHVMRNLLCQVCAGPADINEQGMLWLLGDARGDWPRWPEDMAAVHPPVCLPCAWKSTRLCPHLKSGFVAARVKHYPVVGAYGCFYDPRNPAREPLANAICGYDHSDIRYLIASQLVRRLRGCRLVDLDAEIAARG